MAAEREEVARFTAFLQIRSISGEGPHGSYQAAVDWLQAFVAQHLQLHSEVVSPKAGKPVLIVKWTGTDPSLPCVVLNSHYDVVPVMQEHWEVDAFAAVRTADGRIFGRGAQDMKCVCIQYLEAVRRLKSSGWQPLRTVYLTFVPDEEVGGTEGMALFLQSQQWTAMQPVGIALDEGLANPKNSYTVFYGERTPWWLLVKAQGPTGHGSRFIEGTAMSKLIDVCNKALAFRQEQQTALGHTGGCSHATAKALGDVTTLNITMLKGGVSVDNGATYALNVIPTEAEAGFDVRISPHMQPAEFKALIDDWCKAEGVSWDFAPWTSPIHKHYLTAVDRDVNPWWGVFLDTMAEIGVAVEPEIFPAGTDSRFLRKLGVAALGFSPMRNTPILLHEHNEWLHEDVFLEGITVYEKLIAALASAERLPSESNS
jgi:aminoacylase